MLNMPLAVLVSLALHLATPQEPLGVLRAVPRDQAEANAVITVTFDRPVAAGLGETLDPATIFAIDPPVPGAVDWRDPVTLRFRPTTPMAPLTTYTVTIANSFAAMDGSRLKDPYRFSFRVKGPRVLTGQPANERERARFLAPDQRFELLLGAAGADDNVISALLASARLEFDRACQSSPIRLEVVGQRALSEDDPWHYRYHQSRAPYQRMPEALKIVELVPERSLPRGCGGTLVVRQDIDTPQADYYRWAFRTYGNFTLRGVDCAGLKSCPAGPLRLLFSTPVRGSEVMQHIRVAPQLEFSVWDTTAELAEWNLEAELRPRTAYAIIVEAEISDIFGQSFQGARVAPFTTTGYEPTLSYASGRWLVERRGLRTLAVQHLNVDSLEAIVARVPDSLELKFLSSNWWQWRELWNNMESGAARRTFAVSGDQDERFVTGLRLPAMDARRPEGSTLLAVRVTSPQLVENRRRANPVTVVQVTDLGVHARFGSAEGAVWVTGVGDGAPRPGVKVIAYDSKGQARAEAETGADGIARFPNLRLEGSGGWYDFQGYVAATQEDDRAVVGLSAFEDYLAPWQFNIRGAWGDARKPRAAAVFTERDIYRPGESVHVKAIVRRGSLGALTVPAAADSLRWVFRDREDGVIRDTTVALSRFGTADQRFDLPLDLPLGRYAVEVQLKDGGRWERVNGSLYQVAEYRPPEFLVDVTAEERELFAGDSIRIAVGARYLFGAPMSRAAVTWVARQQPFPLWRFSVPNTDGFYLGERGRWWEFYDGGATATVITQGTDTLDGGGHLGLALELPAPPSGLPATATLEATVTDINRQTVSGSRSLTVHPADFYIGAKPEGATYFWTAGEPQTVSVITVRPDGERLAGVAIDGTIVRREWHQVRRERGGYTEAVGEWVTDTIASCNLTSAAQPVPCQFTPLAGGSYLVSFRAKDAGGRSAATSFYRWATGPDFVPWYDDSRFKMDVIPDKDRYEVGDTATVLFASPFTDAEAWITLEREGIIEERRLRITQGATTLKFPITEAHAPNAFVSIIVVRGRSAPPGPPDDPGRPTIRVGYAELRVTPEVKRLAVDVRPLQDEYRPGDTARVEVRVSDARGAGRQSEVTLWAVDEGVLALTGYQTPDPIDLLYAARGLGVRLSSNLVSVAEQVAADQMVAKGEPGGGGGMDVAGILRSDFRYTAFFLGSVITHAGGRAVASAKLPDNLTTFRLMAVAVTEGDRYGSGESSLLVTRPLLARPALPRFVREGDEFAAGVVVNHRLGGTPSVTVEAETEGVQLLDRGRLSTTLEAGRGREARFRFRGVPGDSATFRFKVSGAGEADAVQKRLKIRPPYYPRAHTIAGVLWDSDIAEFNLPADIDPERSRLVINYGGSTLSIVRGVRRQLEIYPYYCSEQIASAALPLIALYRAQNQMGDTLLSGDPKAEIEEAVAILARRQRADGAIGYWSSDGWSNPWFSAYAGRVLLEARAAGVSVNDSLLTRLGDYLQASLREREFIRSPLYHWYRDDQSLTLADAVAAVDLLRRLGRPDLPTENTLSRDAAQLAWEDRVRLAEVLSERAGRRARDILEPAWAEVAVEGRRAVLPEAARRREFYFRSFTRPTAQLLTATLAIEPDHPLVGPLIETLIQQGRQEAVRPWNTQDYAFAVLALLQYEAVRQEAGDRRVRLSRADRVIDESIATGTAPYETLTELSGLLEAEVSGRRALRVTLDALDPGAPVYYYLTVQEVPLEPPVRPSQQGIEVERWYEKYDAPTPIVSAAEGELVRVRLRITVPNERQFVVLDDPLPAGLEAVDLSLKTVGALPEAEDAGQEDGELETTWYYGSWDYGRWSPFDHKEMRDDRVVYYATVLWSGTYYTSYIARATTPGRFIKAPAHAEEMYNPGVNGRSEGGVFTVVTEER